MTETGVTGRTVLIAGATSAAGLAVCSELAASGARVLAVGSNDERIARLVGSVPDAVGLVTDLADFGQVSALGERIHADHGPIDGLVHLVGGWRGGGGLAAQSDEDWEFLHRRVLTTLRNTTRVFVDDLHASSAGRLIIVSSTSVDHPAPGGANYAAAKAAAEAWVRAIATGFEKSAPAASATIFAVRALDGLEQRLAEEVVALWNGPGARKPLSRLVLQPPN